MTNPYTETLHLVPDEIRMEWEARGREVRMVKTKEEIRAIFIKYLHDEEYVLDSALKDLSELGVVLKVDRKLPIDFCQDVIDRTGATREDAGSYKRSQQDMLKAGAGFFESLI